MNSLAPPRRRRPRPKTLVSLSAIVIGALSLPLIFLLLEASDAGASKVWHLIWRSLTATLLWNTVRLTVVVTVLCAIIGTLCAYCVERTDLPGRHVWAVLVVIPFAMPDFVVSFGWSSLFSWISGFRGAVIVMTLAVYPLVYLPVAASFRGADTGQEEIARSLGASRLGVFFRITLAQARRSILGGCLLVSLVILAEYGAFEILGYRTFTTEIFSEFSIGFDTSSACALSLVIVVISIAVMVGEGAMGGARRVSRSGRGVAPVRTRVTLGRSRLPVLALFSALVLAALGVPIGSAVYWMFEGGADAITGVSLASAAFYTALYSAGRGPARHSHGAAGRPSGRALSHQVDTRVHALDVSSPGHARDRHRTRPVVLLRTARRLLWLRDRAAADRGLRPHVLSLGARGGARVGQPSAPRPRGGGGLTRVCRAPRFFAA